MRSRPSVKNWAQQSGIHFTFGGVTPVNYNDTTYVITPVDGVDRTRHMYITVLTNAESTYLTDRVVGFAMPTQVLPDNKEILQAEGAFRTDYVASSAKGQRISGVHARARARPRSGSQHQQGRHHVPDRR